MYPVMISKMNGRLVPFEVFALYALITLSGQENPKHTSITVSKIDCIEVLLFIYFEERIALESLKHNFLKQRNTF